MKQRVAVGLLGAMMLGSPAYADTVLGVYAGAQAWNMDTEGQFGTTSDTESFSFDTETKGTLYLALEHPVPLIPNIKISRTNMDSSGDTTLSKAFEFGDELFAVDADLSGEFDLTTTDFILYYELFDNDLVSFDFGINGKYVDGTLLVAETGGTGLQSDVEFSGVVPMLYSRAQFGLPFTGWGVYAEGSYLSIDDNTLSDYQVAIVYNMIESLAIDMTLQAGYRATNLELDDLDDVYTDIEFSGVFAGVELHF
ncbi:TIGR04219 family outer membrane beta-barrel protein [Aestuariibacter salexigens]|uniref:TIGR04219 family outer membrane beta-barrel protein n=1 Tax=Aestuariibacter salexigens TaxID=226010 RepID=UPI0004246099|nr:TIGR04219 family outer membrane beta-barrel protein [Aestuariibacter salexigens]